MSIQLTPTKILVKSIISTGFARIIGFESPDDESVPVANRRAAVIHYLRDNEEYSREYDLDLDIRSANLELAVELGFEGHYLEDAVLCLLDNIDITKTPRHQVEGLIMGLIDGKLSYNAATQKILRNNVGDINYVMPGTVFINDAGVVAITEKTVPYDGMIMFTINNDTFAEEYDRFVEEFKRELVL